jgi:3(or 17)beta-hydroxysteroid dehydrogenase
VRLEKKVALVSGGAGGMGAVETKLFCLSRIPVLRVAQPEEIAYSVLYLTSDESSFVTGSELMIDGGFTAQ